MYNVPWQNKVTTFLGVVCVIHVAEHSFHQGHGDNAASPRSNEGHVFTGPIFNILLIMAFSQ